MKRAQLLIQEESEETSVPLEDIAVLVIESNRSSISSALLSRCADLNVLIIVCDQRFLPNGALVPFFQHSRLFKVLKTQMAATKPLQKRLWQKIVRQKISNQAEVLLELGRNNGEKLIKLISQVTSGDATNVEAQASRIYWSALFDDKFKRSGSDRRNMLLNFGYSLFRSALARSVTGHGLCPAIGVGHHSELNCFNLVDDLIEPFRPFVDRRVHSLSYDTAESITKEEKISLYSMLRERIKIGGELHSVFACCEKVISSFADSLDVGSEAELLLPTIEK